jgi:hypothetical protein
MAWAMPQRGAVSMRLAIVILLVAVLAASSRAEESAASEWYGWQTLAVDAVGIALTLVGDGRIGVPIYLLGPVVVHVAHGRPGGAVVALVLRTTLPIAGLAIGDGLANECTGLFCDAGAVVAGMVAGALVASALDAAFLTTVHEAPQGPSPRLQLIATGKSLALRGTF